MGLGYDLVLLDDPGLMEGWVLMDSRALTEDLVLKDWLELLVLRYLECYFVHGLVVINCSAANEKLWLYFGQGVRPKHLKQPQKVDEYLSPDFPV